MKSKNRFSRKVDKIFWLIVALLPIFAYFVVAYRNPEAVTFWAYLGNWRFDAIWFTLESVFTKAFNVSNFFILEYLSYLVGVEIAHCMFDVLVFIPRLAHKFIAKAVQDD